MAVAPAALPDLNALDPAALKALIVAQHDNLIAQHEALVSRETEVENLKLLILKLRRMQFGRKSEKLDRQIEQLELRLEDLEAHAVSPPSDATAVHAAEELRGARCQITCPAKHKRWNRSRRRAQNAAAPYASWEKTYRNFSSLCRHASK